MELPTQAEARAMKYERRVIAAIRIDRYMLELVRDYRNSPYWNGYYFFLLEDAALSRYYLTHDEDSCVGIIHNGRLLLWAEVVATGKQEAAHEYAVKQEVIG